MKGALEKVDVTLAAGRLHLVDAPDGPGMYGWVDVVKRPFVRRKLTCRGNHGAAGLASMTDSAS